MNLYVDGVSSDLWARALYCTFCNEINLKSTPSLYIIMLLLHLTSRTTLSLPPNPFATHLADLRAPHHPVGPVASPSFPTLIHPHPRALKGT